MGEPLRDVSLYDRDILAWSEQQAAALRTLAARRDLPNELDLEKLVEEVESVGRSQLNAVESRIRRILVHLLKLASVPAAPSRAHWVEDILRWHGDILATLSPSMRQRIALDPIWRRAVREARGTLEVHGDALYPDVPAYCPLELDTILGESFDWRAATARIAGPGGGGEGNA